MGMQVKSNKKKNNQNMSKPPKRRSGNYWIYITAAVLVVAGLMFAIPSPVTEITWKDFEKRMLSGHAIEKVQVVNNEVAEVFIKKELLSDAVFKDITRPMMSLGARPGPHYKFT